MATNLEKPGQTGAGMPTQRDRGSFMSLRDEMDRMFDDFFSEFSMMPFRGWRPGTGGAMEMKVPAIDVVEKDSTFRITAELPGIEEKDVDVSITDDILTIRGEKRMEHEEKSDTRRLSERSYGSFERSLRLPPGVDPEKIAADFRKGVLTVTLPKNSDMQKRQRKIEVRSE